LLILGANLESVIGREISRTIDGRRINLDLRGASDALVSDTSFLQFRATARWIRSLNDRTRIITRGRAGFTIKDSLSELPASVRFFTGGDRNLRGYDYQSIGPVDEDGVVIGASYVLEGSLEFDYLVRGNWAVAAFADIGSAFNDRPEFSRGVGLGLRWYSPVGPVRLDFAHPLDDPDSNFRLHVVLGPDL
ncbi:MAG: BamA/TamA family outer membrane protein, partial [Gammaproteobacteria bacterium]|nr:BamA/TamA family outer membrane protein [Gammaproteobacteria bacterium]